MKKLVVLIVTFALLLSGVAFAQDGEDLKLTGWPYEPDVVNENLDRFTDQYGIEAEFLPLPSNEYRDKMVANFVAGTEYDVVYVRDSFLAEWAAAGWIVPIDGMEGVEDYIADLPQGIIDQMSYEGELYGLPYYSGNKVLSYNQAHFEAAGIEGPPATWDEMFDQARAIKDAGVVTYPILLELRTGENYIMQQLEILTFARGGRLFTDDYQPVFQEDAGFGDTLMWIQQGLDEGLIDPASLTDDDGTLLIMAGLNTFMTPTDYSLKAMNDPEQSQVAGDIMNAMIPGTEEVESGTLGYVRLYAITADAPDKDAAWQLVQFLGGRDATGEYFVPKRWALEFGLGFSPAPLYEDEEVRNSISGWIDPDLLNQQAEFAVSRPYRFVPFWADWEIEAGAALQDVVLGNADMDETLEELAELWLELKDDYGY